MSLPRSGRVVSRCCNWLRTAYLLLGEIGRMDRAQYNAATAFTASQCFARLIHSPTTQDILWMKASGEKSSTAILSSNQLSEDPNG